MNKTAQKVSAYFDEQIKAQTAMRDRLLDEYVSMVKNENLSGTSESLELLDKISTQEKEICQLKDYRKIWVKFVDVFISRIRSENKQRPDYDIDIYDDGDPYKVNVICNKHILSCELWGSCSRDIGSDLLIRYAVYMRHSVPTKWNEIKLNLEYDAGPISMTDPYKQLLAKVLEKEHPIRFKPNSRV